MPLHVFEPRYRQMVARCLEYDRQFGLIYHDPERLGAFGTEPGRVGTVVEISDFQILPDGRSLMLVTGVERFRIEDGIESETLYHEGLIDTLDDREPADIEALMLRRQSSIALFASVVERLRDDVADADTLRELDPAEEVSFRIAERIHVDAAWTQALIELPDEVLRLDRIDRLLGEVLFRSQAEAGEDGVR
jgi:Lon protease-like protein